MVAFGFACALILAELLLRALTPLQLGFEYRDGRFGPPREFGIHSEVNAFGAHDAEPLAKADGVQRVLLLGDSFVQGLAVSIEDTVARRLAHHLPGQGPGAFDVVSLAYGGASPADELRLLRDAGSQLKPNRVISVFYAGNDVMQSMPAAERETVLESGRVLPVFHGAAHVFGRDDARFFLVEESRLNQLISQRVTVAARKRETAGVPIAFLVYSTSPDAPWHGASESAWARVEDLLQETRAAAAALGADYGVVSVASSYAIGGEPQLEEMIASYPDMRGFGWDLEQPDERLAALCARDGIPFLSLLGGFREGTRNSDSPLHWKYDRHWTPEGHDRAAREISAFITNAENWR